ncbi:hypothetical protein QE152_g37049 [Popillia japonica]|uniref:Uncharacterized protein n=1 Tax=Popillia japonica TaxID=7064 RepID=A0AAW1IBP0_POPJA
MITRRNKTYLERGLVSSKRGLADLDRILLNKDKLSNLVSFVQNQNPKKLCGHENSNQFTTVTRWLSKKLENYVKTDPKLGTTVSKSAQNLGMCGCYLLQVYQPPVIRHQAKTDSKQHTMVAKLTQNQGYQIFKF